MFFYVKVRESSDKSLKTTRTSSVKKNGLIDELASEIKRG